MLATKDKKRGNVAGWLDKRVAALGQSDRTLRLYMQIATFVAEKSATPLPKAILARPLRDIPTEIQNAACIGHAIGVPPPFSRRHRPPDDPASRHGASDVDRTPANGPRQGPKRRKNRHEDGPVRRRPRRRTSKRHPLGSTHRQTASAARRTTDSAEIALSAHSPAAVKPKFCPDLALKSCQKADSGPAAPFLSPLDVLSSAACRATPPVATRLAQRLTFDRIGNFSAHSGV